METEDDLFRPPPSSPYQPVDLQLRVPSDALTATLDLLRGAGRRESGLFWYGLRDSSGNGIVTYVVAPRQRMSRGNYHISAQDMGEVVHRLPDDWKPLAQVHSHPGVGVEHSRYDDHMLSSRRVLSLVFPSYGRGRRVFPAGVGVHEWQNGYWHLLDFVSARHRVVPIDARVRVEDLR
jgi:hypothetical protein